MSCQGPKEGSMQQSRWAIIDAISLWIAMDLKIGATMLSTGVSALKLVSCPFPFFLLKSGFGRRGGCFRLSHHDHNTDTVHLRARV